MLTMGKREKAKEKERKKDIKVDERNEEKKIERFNFLLATMRVGRWRVFASPLYPISFSPPTPNKNKKLSTKFNIRNNFKTVSP